MVLGTCKLCLKGSELQDSHILPSWSYKRAREEGARNPNPVVLRDGLVFQTSKQDSEHMLCRTCEQRMQPGERYVHGISYQGDRSERFTSLVGNVLHAADDGTRACTPGKLDHVLLTYFGASVLWRASVAHCLPACSLGRYEEAFRLYLLDATPFPSCAGLILAFHDLPTEEGSYIGSICMTPTSERTGRHHTHRFTLFGLSFYFAVGKELPAWCNSTCFARGAQRYVLLKSQEQLLQGPGRWMAGARISPKLAARSR